MNKEALIYVGKVMFQRILAFLLFLFGSWWYFAWNHIVYFVSYFIISLISILFLYRTSKQTLAKRNKIKTSAPKWDKVLMSLYWLLHFYIVYLIAGLEAKNKDINLILFVIGIAFVVLSTIITIAAIYVNTYLESTARIQTDRNQKVVSNGIYRIIRHPTYLAVLISCFAISFAFQTLYTIIITIIIAIIIIIRTSLEDKMLRKGLEGYQDYCLKTKYRLIPFVW